MNALDDAQWRNPAMLRKLIHIGTIFAWDNNAVGGILILDEELISMCDYSLHQVQSRAAKVGDKLTTRNFGTGTRGFAAPESPATAVCVLPGTELAFSDEVAFVPPTGPRSEVRKASFKTAVFRQVNKDMPRVHHDALEFPDGQTVHLTDLCDGQLAVVLQLPAQPATEAEAEAQKRVEYIG